jgi:hypothetical protein
VKQCFNVVIERCGKYNGNREKHTVVASSAIVAIHKATAAARREHGPSRWEAVELAKIGDVS